MTRIIGCLDLYGLTNSISSAQISININTLLPVILAIKAAFIVGILVKDNIGFLFPYPIHAGPLTKVPTFLTSTKRFETQNSTILTDLFNRPPLYSSTTHRYQWMADFSKNSSFGDSFDIAFFDNINESSDIVFFERNLIKIKPRTRLN